jgi:hypothetical protein
MSWVISFILVGIWAAALVTGFTFGGYIHIVVALAIGVIVMHVRGIQAHTV